MTRFESFVILFIVSLIAILSNAVLHTAQSIEEEVKEINARQEVKHLPTECAVYYNDGTDQWIDCMNVGYK